MNIDYDLPWPAELSEPQVYQSGATWFWFIPEHIALEGDEGIVAGPFPTKKEAQVDLRIKLDEIKEME